MNQYLQNLATVSAVLISKHYAFEKFLKYHPDAEIDPDVEIFDHDFEEAKSTFATFAAMLQEMEQKKYVRVYCVGLKEAWDKELQPHLGTLYKIANQGQLCKPGVRFRVSIIGNIWRLYDAITQEENIDAVNVGTCGYIESDCSLLVQGQKIQVQLKNEAPGEHYILAHMMKNGFENTYTFSEMIKEEDVWEGHDHRAYFDACKNLNGKIAKQTGGKVTGFLIVTSGKTGHVRVNPRYL